MFHEPNRTAQETSVTNTSSVPGQRLAGARSETTGAHSWTDATRGDRRNVRWHRVKSESGVVAKSLHRGDGGTTPGNAGGNDGDPERANTARVWSSFKGES
jgi:hypothetical protein